MILKRSQKMYLLLFYYKCVSILYLVKIIWNIVCSFLKEILQEVLVWTIYFQKLKQNIAE